MGKFAVVVPTCRPEEFARFEDAWADLFAKHDVTLYPVRDEPQSWDEWPDWVPRRSDMCRSLGFYWAWRDGHEFTLSLDDDVRPSPYYDIFEDYEYGFDRTWPCVPYLSVGSLTTAHAEMRGFPYEGRSGLAMVQYGGWHGMLDYDGKTQLALGRDAGHEEFPQLVIPVPRGCAVTTCSMNMAFRTEFTPAMWQLPVLDGYPRRWGDIWSGLLQKRELDDRGEVMLINGRASVLHERASDPIKNAEIEAPGFVANERIWEDLTNPLGSHFPYIKGVPREWADHYMRCRETWLALFDA